MFTQECEGTTLALRLLFRAGISAVQDEPVVCFRAQLRRKSLFKVLFYCERSLPGRQSDSSGYAEHVGVHGDYRFSPCYRCNHVGSLASYARKSHQLVNVRGDFAVEVFRYLSGRPDKVGRFAVRVRYGFYDGKYLLRLGFGK